MFLTEVSGHAAKVGRQSVIATRRFAIAVAVVMAAGGATLVPTVDALDRSTSDAVIGVCVVVVLVASQVALAVLRRAHADRIALVEQVRFTQALLDTVNVAIVAVDAGRNVIHANRSARSSLGAALNRSVAEWVECGGLFEADGQTPLTADRLPLARCLAEGSISGVELVSRPPGGPVSYSRVDGRALQNFNGAVVGAVVVAEDITAERDQADRTQLETERLRQVAAVQRAILDRADDFAATVRVAAELAHELSGGDGAVLEIIHGSDLVYEGATGSLADQVGLHLPRAGSLSGIAASARSTQHCRDTFLDERVNRAATDRLGIRSMVIAPVGHRGEVFGTLKIAAGTPSAFDEAAVLRLELVAETVGSALAVSKLLQENQELFVSAERQRAVSERLLAAISDLGEGVTVGAGERLVYANQAFCELTGYGVEELLAMESSAVLVDDEEERGEWVRRRSAMAVGEEVGRMEARLRTRTGTVVPIEFSSTRLEDAGGEVQRLHVIRDITHRHEWERAMAERADALERANEELRSLESMRADFLAAVSHDFRTPLTSIVGYLQLATDSDPEVPIASVAPFLVKVERASIELQRRVDMFLDFSKGERSALDFDLVPTDLTALTTEAVDAIAPELRRSVVLSSSSGSSCVAAVDVRSYVRVVENLVNNAIKYSDDGTTVEIDVALRGDVVQIRVADRGRGIAEGDLDRVFDSYYRASDVRGATQGSGIGLAVVRQFVDGMGGRIWAERREGGGSVFSVELAACPAP